ncbi:MAG: hypothetical protein ABI867_34775 [Kofleriaceae bacterium]
MSNLPFLIEHGAVIAKVAVATIAVCGLAAFQLVRRHRDRRQARRDADRLSLSVDEPRLGPIAVVGRFCETDRSLTVSGARVALDGEIIIIRGSRARWTRGTRTYSIHDGDQIIAVGDMTNRADASDPGYRESGGGWRLAPSPHDLGIPVCATRPPTAPPPLWPLRGVLALALSGAVGYLTLAMIGSQLVGIDPVSQPPYREPAMGNLTIAAALPGSRERAVRQLRTRYEKAQRSPKTLDVLVELVGLDGDCSQQVEVQTALGRFEGAIATATACGKPELAADALVALGRYTEAAQLPIETHGLWQLDRARGIAALAVGRWSDAVTILLRARDHAGPTAECLVAYLQARAGDAAARDRLAAGAKRSPGCKRINEATTFGGRREVDVWLDNGHASLATRAMLLGHFDQATAEAAEVERPIRTQLEWTIALRTGAPIGKHPDDPQIGWTVAEAASVRSEGRITSLDHFAVDSRASACPALARTALAEALAGDGAGVAHVLAACLGGVHFDVEYVLAVMPSVTRDRAAVSNALALQDRASIPYGLVAQLAMERDVARLASETAVADRLQTIIERHAKVLGEPAIGLWEALYTGAIDAR